MMRGNPRPEILYGKFHILANAPTADDNPATLPAIFDRILNQVAKDLLHGIRISPD
jgi:hypothetical protein